MFAPQQQSQQQPHQEEEVENQKSLLGFCSFCVVRGFIRLKRKFSDKQVLYRLFLFYRNW